MVSDAERATAGDRVTAISAAVAATLLLILQTVLHAGVIPVGRACGG
jgi:hypothetical protein